MRLEMRMCACEIEGGVLKETHTNLVPRVYGTSLKSQLLWQ